LVDYYLIGEIKASYADEGFALVYSFSDYIDRIVDLEFVFIEIFGVKKRIFVDRVEISGKDFLIKFKNFEKSEHVAALIGSRLYVDKDNVVSPEDGTFFVHDLLGCKMYFGEKFFGDVVDFLQLKANDVYVVHDTNGEEHLIPAVKDYIKSINIDKKRIELTYDLDSMFYDED
jgi:16S rRNA processing protein RimM